MTIRPLDDPSYPVGNMVNPAVEKRREKQWQSIYYTKPMGDVLEDLRQRAMPAKIVRYEKLTLQPEYPNVGEFHD